MLLLPGGIAYVIENMWTREDEKREHGGVRALIESGHKNWVIWQFQGLIASKDYFKAFYVLAQLCTSTGTCLWPAEGNGNFILKKFFCVCERPCKLPVI